jgi:hypothetical protein
LAGFREGLGAGWEEDLEVRTMNLLSVVERIIQAFLAWDMGGWGVTHLD